MGLKEFITEQLDLIRPEDAGYDDDLGETVEDYLNNIMPNLGEDSHVYVDVDEARGEVNVDIGLDGVITMDLVNNIAQKIATKIPVNLIGFSGGSGPFAVVFHFKVQR